MLYIARTGREQFFWLCSWFLHKEKYVQVTWGFFLESYLATEFRYESLILVFNRLMTWICIKYGKIAVGFELVTFKSVESQFHQHLRQIRYFGKQMFSSFTEIFTNQLECNDETKLDQMGREKREVIQMQGVNFKWTCVMLWLDPWIHFILYYSFFLSL